MMKTILIMVAFIVNAQSLNSKSIEGLINRLMLANSRQEEIALYPQIFHYGKDAIPCLIKSIDIDRKTYAGVFKPLNSNLKSLINYNGVHAAYLIELILAKESLNIEKGTPEDTYAIFNRDIIIKQKFVTPLELKDLINIKILYAEWWKKNSGKSLGQMRKEWKNNNRALIGSAYRWY